MEKAEQSAGHPSASHWSEQREKTAGYWPLKLILIIFRLFPVLFLRLCMFPVSFCYFIFSKNAREESARFLHRAEPLTAKQDSRRHPGTYRHLLSFALNLIEKVQSWGGKFSFKHIHFQQDDVEDLISGLERGEGALLICSHLGNAELLRGLASFNRTGVSRSVPVTSIVDFSGTAYFNKMLNELNPESMLHIISANDIGPDTIIMLMERIEAGELVVIAGDRTSTNARDRCLLFPFLGKPAPFPYGAFFLASILKAPAYFVFALREREISVFPEYVMHVHKSRVSFDCLRRERDARIEELARDFASRLEFYSREHPCQWYNFYDFWAEFIPPEAGWHEST